MEEDEDRVLLSSLGVTSANPEDIERDILSQVLILINCIFLYRHCLCCLRFVLKMFWCWMSKGDKQWREV